MLVPSGLVVQIKKNKMKKIYSIFAIVTGLSLLASCNKDSMDSPNSDKKVPMTFGLTLSNESDFSTRAAVDRLDLTRVGQDIYWEGGDQVTIFAENHTYGDTFTFTGDYGYLHNTGSFSGMTYETQGYYGLYPAQSSAKLSYDNGKGRLSFNIPNKQTAKKDSFDPKAAIMTGKADSWGDNTLALNHVCAYFSIKVGPGCNTIRVEAVANANQPAWYLAGNVIAEVSSGSTAIKDFENSKCQSFIVLSGSALYDGGTFLIPFIPSTKCPKIIVTPTFYAQTNSQNQPQKSFVPKNQDGSDAKYQFVAGYIYELGSYESSMPAPDNTAPTE